VSEVGAAMTSLRSLWTAEETRWLSAGSTATPAGWRAQHSTGEAQRLF